MRRWLHLATEQEDRRPHRHPGEEGNPSVGDGAWLASGRCLRDNVRRPCLVADMAGALTAGRARHVSRPHVVTVAAYAKDGSLILANPMTVSIRRHR